MSLVPADLGPGNVPTGFAESMLERARRIEDPALLWDGATTAAALAQKWNGHGREKNELKAAQMFCEVELGQRLGPNPGDAGKGAWADEESPRADSLIPKQRVEEMRRYFGLRDALVAAVRDGARSRRSLLLLADQLNAVEVDPDEVEVRDGDFREVLGDVEPGSVALVLTDPPYPAKYAPLWDDLGAFARVALVDGGSLVAYTGQSILPTAVGHLGRHLTYWWILALTHGYGTAMLPGKNVSIGWKPLLWYVRDRRRTEFMLADRISGSPPRKTLDTGDTGNWAQGVTELEPIISALTSPGDLIVDPFAGSGSTGVAALRFGRRFIGADL